MKEGDNKETFYLHYVASNFSGIQFANFAILSFLPFILSPPVPHTYAMTESHQVAVIASNFELAEMIQNYKSDDIGECWAGLHAA